MDADANMGLHLTYQLVDQGLPVQASSLDTRVFFRPARNPRSYNCGNLLLETSCSGQRRRGRCYQRSYCGQAVYAVESQQDEMFLARTGVVYCSLIDNN
jgi:hypothetical protein